MHIVIGIYLCYYYCVYMYLYLHTHVKVHNFMLAELCNAVNLEFGVVD